MLYLHLGKNYIPQTHAYFNNTFSTVSSALKGILTKH